ncbi:MAG: glutamine amidotransferase [Glaciihabitans sp.]|nr:glutamine amidotransferase [Glaciihabitans sp.]
MKPFLLLAARSEDEAADDEYAGFLESTGLAPHQLTRVRVEAAPLPEINLDDYSGIIVGGSPFNVSDPADAKSDTQTRVERELWDLIDDVLARDFPLFGACYGVGLLTSAGGGVVDGTWPEEAGPTRVTLTDAAAEDQLFRHLEGSFDAFVGHKEACSTLPPGAVLLAGGEACPVQAFRLGRNAYATQFHPELTRSGILTRIRIYKNNGYFDPDAIDDIIAAIGSSQVTEPARLLRAFVETFAVD